MAAPARAPGVALTVPAADAEELRQHEAMLDLIHKASGGKAVWRVGGPADAPESDQNAQKSLNTAGEGLAFGPPGTARSPPQLRPSA